VPASAADLRRRTEEFVHDAVISHESALRPGGSDDALRIKPSESE
jgi:hypothetical protein